MTDITREQIEALLKYGSTKHVSTTLARQLLATMTERDEAQAEMNDWREGDLRGVMAHMDAFRARAEALETALAEAQAAQAGVVSSAFEAGAKAVHDEWVRAHQAGETPPCGEPDFSEAASDYASLADPTGVKLLAEMKAEIERLRSLCGEGR